MVGVSVQTRTYGKIIKNNDMEYQLFEEYLLI